MRSEIAFKSSNRTRCRAMVALLATASAIFVWTSPGIAFAADTSESVWHIQAPANANVSPFTPAVTFYPSGAWGGWTATGVNSFFTPSVVTMHDDNSIAVAWVANDNSIRLHRMDSAFHFTALGQVADGGITTFTPSIVNYRPGDDLIVYHTGTNGHIYQSAPT